MFEVSVRPLTESINSLNFPDQDFNVSTRGCPDGYYKIWKNYGGWTVARHWYCCKDGTTNVCGGASHTSHDSLSYEINPPAKSFKWAYEQVTVVTAERIQQIPTLNHDRIAEYSITFWIRVTKKSKDWDTLLSGNFEPHTYHTLRNDRIEEGTWYHVCFVQYHQHVNTDPYRMKVHFSVRRSDEATHTRCPHTSFQWACSSGGHNEVPLRFLKAGGYKTTGEIVGLRVFDYQIFDSECEGWGNADMPPMTLNPTTSPTTNPTSNPTTTTPTHNPTLSPTNAPTTSSPFTANPTVNPTNSPTSYPSLAPVSFHPGTSTPTTNPITYGPTHAPITTSPSTHTPSTAPTTSPTLTPTSDSPATHTPTVSPTTHTPTVSPTPVPSTSSPTSSPTELTTVLIPRSEDGTTSPTYAPDVDGSSGRMAEGAFLALVICLPVGMMLCCLCCFFLFCAKKKDLQCKRCGTQNTKAVLKKYPRGDYVCQECGFYSPYYKKFSIFRKTGQERHLRKYNCTDCGATYSLTEQEWKDDQYWHCDSCDTKGHTLKILKLSDDQDVNIEGVQLVRNTEQSEDQVVLGSADFRNSEAGMMSKSDTKSDRHADLRLMADSVSDAKMGHAV